MISDVEHLITATTNCNKNQYKWCTSCNNGNGAWGCHWKVGHREWKENQSKKNSVHFFDPATNAVIYCSYLMAISEKYTKEYIKDGDKIWEFF